MLNYFKYALVIYCTSFIASPYSFGSSNCENGIQNDIPPLATVLQEEGISFDRVQTVSESTVLVVGAGPSGVVATKKLMDLGMKVTTVEKTDRIGGLWSDSSKESPAFPGLRTISSAKLHRFSELSYSQARKWLTRNGHDDPGVSKDGYLDALQVAAYIKAYSAKFGVDEKIEMGLGVEKLWVVSRPNLVGVWPYQILAKFSSGNYELYKGVALGSGPQRVPKVPEIADRIREEMPQVKVRHASQIEDFNSYQGQKLIVVGGGQTGLDVATNAAKNGATVYLSLRRGYHYIPRKVGFGFFSQTPEDFSKLSSSLQFPLWFRQKLFKPIVRILVGNLKKYGFQEPDHAFLTNHPTILPEGFLELVKSGRIIVRGELRSFDPENQTIELRDTSPKSAEDTSGEISVTRLAHVNEVVFATGYKHSTVPFIGQGSGFPMDENGKLDLRLRAFMRDSRIPAVFLGNIESDGSALPIIERQAEVFVEMMKPSGLSRINTIINQTNPAILLKGLYSKRSDANTSDRNEVGVDKTIYRRSLEMIVQESQKQTAIRR